MLSTHPSIHEFPVDASRHGINSWDFSENLRYIAGFPNRDNQFDTGGIFMSELAARVVSTTVRE